MIEHIPAHSVIQVASLGHTVLPVDHHHAQNIGVLIIHNVYVYLFPWTQLPLN